MDARGKGTGEATRSTPPSEKATQWLAMMRHSGAAIVGWVSKQKSVSGRCRVRARAWAETFPTYANIIKKVQRNGNKADTYGDLLGEGECVCCSGGHPDVRVRCQLTSYACTCLRNTSLTALGRPHKVYCGGAHHSCTCTRQYLGGSGPLTVLVLSPTK